MAEQGPLPDLSGRGTQGLFDQSTRPANASGNAGLPGAGTQPSLPGSSGGDDGSKPRPGKKKSKAPKRKPLRRVLLLVHVTVALVALVSIARNGPDVNFPKVTTPTFDFSNLADNGSGHVAASRTMVIVPSGRVVENGVYLARPAAIKGAAAQTAFEFALTGRRSHQHVVYIAGVHVRDRSCDRRPPNSTVVSGLILYNDEGSTNFSTISGRSITAGFQRGKERIDARAVSSRTITGTFHFGAYTGCDAGGKFTFTATRRPDDEPVLAKRMMG